MSSNNSMISLLVCAKSISMYDLNSFSANSLAIVLFPIRFAPLISNEYLSLHIFYYDLN